MQKRTQKLRADYEQFLVEIDFLLEDLNELLANSRGYQTQRVAYDGDSLDAIEQFYLDVLAGKETISLSQARLNRIIIAFYGEAVRERAGGNWAFCEDENDTGFGLPVVANWGQDVIAFSPVEIREAQRRDRQPCIRDSVEYCADKDAYEAKLFDD